MKSEVSIQETQGTGEVDHRYATGRRTDARSGAANGRTTLRENTRTLKGELDLNNANPGRSRRSGLATGRPAIGEEEAGEVGRPPLLDYRDKERQRPHREYG